MSKHLKHVLLKLICLFFVTISFAQTQKLGALFLTDAQYAALPRPNWTLLQQYSSSSSQSGAYGGANGVTMLVNPPIGDQGSEGSCVGWAVGYSAMGILTYPKYYCWTTAERSPNYVYNQIKASADCASGSYPKDAVNLVKTQGDCSWLLMPYANGNCTTLPNGTQQNDAAQNKAVDWAALDKNDVAGIKHALDLGFPVVNAFDVTQAFDDMWGNGGVWSSNYGSSRGGHATCIIGYDDTRQQFKVQNQWGAFGGDNGYYWVTYSMVQNNCMRELYIVYGTTPNLAPYINGDDVVCATSNAYTLTNLPASSAVQWQASPAGIVTINTPNATQTTLTKNSDGNATLTATITNSCGGTFTVSKPVVVGVPLVDFSVQSYWFDETYCANSFNRFTIQPQITNVTGFQWGYSSYQNGIPPTVAQDPGSYDQDIIFPTSGYYQVYARAENACGLGTTQTLDLYVSDFCSGGLGMSTYSVAPNPTSGDIQINSVDEKGTIKEVRIADKAGNVRRRVVYPVKHKAVSINLSALPADLYFVQIFDGVKWSTKTVFKK
jgi:hypothetical protein